MLSRACLKHWTLLLQHRDITVVKTEPSALAHSLLILGKPHKWPFPSMIQQCILLVTYLMGTEAAGGFPAVSLGVPCHPGSSFSEQEFTHFHCCPWLILPTCTAGSSQPQLEWVRNSSGALPVPGSDGDCNSSRSRKQEWEGRRGATKNGGVGFLPDSGL